MAKWVIEDEFGINTEDLNFTTLADGEIVEATKRKVTLDLGGGFIEFLGSGFEYKKSGVLIDGTIRSFTLHDGDDPVYTISGLSLSVKEFKSVAMTVSDRDDHRLLVRLLDGADHITGGDIGNNIYGYGGNDVLAGGAGEDFIAGGSGRDLIHGGFGADTLFGDGGADQFFYVLAGESDASGPRTMDLIADFSRAEKDKIVLSEVSSFTFAGEKSLSGISGELVFGRYEGQTFISGDIDGDGVADIVIALDDEIVLKGTDFIL